MWLLILSCILTIAYNDNLAYNGDFELPSEQSPPPGWTMWGAGKYKDPANYTLDGNNPHSGASCFRIHHPSGTAGYIVSAPEHALQSQKGMMYTVSFWARTDKPGPSVFYFESYSSIQPFVDAPSPGHFLIDVSQEWKHYSFEIHEGWDFFVQRSRLIMLGFKATTNNQEEKTLWLDDVVISEQDSSREGSMIDEDTLDSAPLQHRLRSGEQLNFTVDTKKRLRRATRDASGVSFHRVAGWTRAPYDRSGEYTLSPGLEQAVREMRLPMTRFYAVGDESFSLESAIDKAAEVCQRVGIPEDHTVLEFETQGATSKLPPEVWARGVRHSVRQGYKFRHWEVANEPYLMRPGTAFPSPDVYINHLKAVSAAIREVQPDSQIGIAVHPRSLTWGNYVLKQTAGFYDFVVGHHYAVQSVHKLRFEVAVLTENFRKLEAILRLNALIHAYNPDRDVYQYDTEWGMHSGGPDGEKADYVDRNANIFGTLHRAVRLVYYAREDILRGASSWEMFSRTRSQGFGILSPDVPDERFLIYWLYYYFNRHMGDWVLDMDGTAPYYTPAERDDTSAEPGAFSGPITPALVTLSKDGKTVYLVIVNGSWDRNIPCSMDLRNFEINDASGTVLSHPDPDGKPLLERKEDAISELSILVAGQRITCTIPAHSVVFVKLQGL